MKSLKLTLLLITLIFLFSSCSNDIKNEKIEGNTCFVETEFSLDAGRSIMLGQGATYGYILKYVWSVSRSKQNLTIVDVKLIISGDDGYGNQKKIDWCHLRFDSDILSELRRYSDFSKLSYSEIADVLDNAGMKKLKDYKGDLSKDAFN